jgi:hypothetical protein
MLTLFDLCACLVCALASDNTMMEQIPSMANGGLAWFMDLTTPDAYYGLPVLCTLSTLALVESGLMSAEMGMQQSQMMKWAMRAMACIFIPAGGYMPAAVTYMWAINSVLAMIQAGALRRPAVRAALGLPTVAAQRAQQEASAKSLESSMQSTFADWGWQASSNSSSSGSSAGGGEAGSSRPAGGLVPPPPGQRPSLAGIKPTV